MQKTYAKPQLTRAGVISRITAVDSCPSGSVFVLGSENGSGSCVDETTPPDNGNGQSPA